MIQKKSIALLMATVMGISTVFTACNNDNENNKSDKQVRREEFEAYDNDEPVSIGYSSIDTTVNPFYANPSNENSIASYMYLKLLSTDEKGNIVNFNSASENDGSIADISSSYDKDIDVTTYTVDIHDDVLFSDGTELDADDVIFSYYVYADPSYDGPVNISSYNICGMKNYMKNNSMADSITVSEKEIKNTVSKPDKATKKYIKKLISDTLSAEFDRFDSLYNDPDWTTYTSAYPKKKDLFAAVYGIKEGYDSSKVKKNQVLKDIISQYGTDYKTLAKKYANDKTYFDNDINNYVKDNIYNQKLKKQGRKVTSIDGIKKTGDYEVQISVNGQDNSSVYGLFDIYIASLTGYKECNKNYDYDDMLFGITRGDTKSIKKIQDQPCDGPYVCKSKDKESIELTANDKYFDGVPFVSNLKIVKVEDANMPAAIDDGTIDMGICQQTPMIQEQIDDFNSDKTVIGQNQFPYAGYAYIGVNADKVMVGNNNQSKKSIALRKAFTTIFEYYRNKAVSEYFGSCATAIDYPVSRASWSYIVGDASLGNDVKSSDKKELKNLKKQVKDYLLKAGFSYNKKSKKFTKAPKGASLSYNIYIPQNTNGQNPAWQLANDSANILSEFGITLNVISEKKQSSFWKYVSNGTANMWAGSWNIGKDPDLYQFYYSGNIYGSGGTNTNYYRFADKSVDELIVKSRISNDYSIVKAAYKEIMDKVMESGVIVPFYQRNMLLIYSPDRVDESTFDKDKISSFKGIAYIVNNIKRK